MVVWGWGLRTDSVFSLSSLQPRTIDDIKFSDTVVWMITLIIFTISIIHKIMIMKPIFVLFSFKRLSKYRITYVIFGSKPSDFFMKQICKNVFLPRFYIFMPDRQ